MIMMDPFTAWSRMMAAGFVMQKAWLEGMETLHASHQVIAARAGKIHDAIASPGDADHAELARMVPEKVEAFGLSAGAIARNAVAMHSAWSDQMRRLATMMMAGRMPTLHEASTFATRTTAYGLGAMGAGARMGKGAIAPIHRTATGNARRLERAKAKAPRR